MRAMELPQDIDPHLLAAHWIGGTDLLVEQHRGILRFQSDMIRFASEQGILIVSGNDLTMSQLTASRAMIFGDIRSVSFEEKS